MTVGKIVCLIGDLVCLIWLVSQAVSIHSVDLGILVCLISSVLFRIGTMCASIGLQYVGIGTDDLLVCTVVYLAGTIGWLVSLSVTYRFHNADFCVIGMLGYGFMMFWCILSALIFSCFDRQLPSSLSIWFHFGPRAELPISIPRLGLRRQASLRTRATATPLPDAAASGHRADALALVSSGVDLTASRRHISLQQKISEVKRDKAALIDQNLKLVHDKGQLLHDKDQLLRDKEQLLRDNGRLTDEKAVAEERSVQLSDQVNQLRSRITVLEMPAEMRAAECPICCEPYNEKRLSAFVPCGHTMCAVCALQIFESPTTCSLCRKPITAVQTIHFSSV